NVNDGLFAYNEGFPYGWDGKFTNSSGFTNRVLWRAIATSNFDLASTNDLPGDVWHRIILWHKQGVELGLKVDNQPSETMSFTNIMQSTGVPWEWYLTGTDNKIDFDEI